MKLFFAGQHTVWLTILCVTIANVGRRLNADEQVNVLIEELVHAVESSDKGAASWEECEFQPLAVAKGQDSEEHTGYRRAIKQVMVDIISLGAAAVPGLVEHISDGRKIKPVARMSWIEYPDEYDYNRLTRKDAPSGVNRKSIFFEDHPESHELTVGDLCFVCLGNIVNRDFSAAHYQPSGGMVINSPTYSAKLRHVIISDWSNFDRDAHQRLLVEDFRFPDHLHRRLGAYRRLTYYYPELVETLVLQALEQPVLDEGEISSFCESVLYKTVDSVEQARKLDEWAESLGSAYREGVREYLFHDLASEESYEDLSPSPAEPTNHQRRLQGMLHKLFATSANVRSTDRPIVHIATQRSRAWLIKGLIHDRNSAITDYVHSLLLANRDDERLAPACVYCLANRGVPAILIAELSRIDLHSAQTSQLHLAMLSALVTSREPEVVERLCEGVTETTNTDYLGAAMMGLAKTVPDRCRLKLEQMLGMLPPSSDKVQTLMEVATDYFYSDAPQIFQNYLQEGSIERAAAVCRRFLRGGSGATEILAPLLADRRRVAESSPTRICDLAAQSIIYYNKDIAFDAAWPESKRDAVIVSIKEWAATRKETAKDE